MPEVTQWPAYDVERTSVRVVLRDDAGSVLLFRTIDPTMPEIGEWWELPGGGVEGEETYAETASREIEEETGLQVGSAAGQVQVRRLLGLLAYELVHRGLGVSYTFATYHFLVELPQDAVLNPHDASERIAGWQWRAPAELDAIANMLQTVGTVAPRWADWGRYRALSHRFVAESLR